MTEGVGDPVRGGGLRGWADRLAESLHEADDSLIYVNLAKRGLKTAEVRDRQLQAAVSLEPDLASVLVGMNDLLDPGFDPRHYDEELDSLVRPLADSGALVLTATFPDITSFSPLPKRFTAGIKTRLDAASDVVREVSDRHGTLMLDEDALPEPLEREILSVDRLHPSPRGHVLVARLFARALEERAGVRIPLPKEENLAGKLIQARWLLRQLDVGEVARFFRRFYAPSGGRRAS